MERTLSDHHTLTRGTQCGSPANIVQNGYNVGTNTAIDVSTTDNTATKPAASESSKPNGRQRIRANRHQRTRSGSL